MFYIPQLDGGLISMKKITEQGYHVTFKENTYHIYQGRWTIARGDFEIYSIRNIQVEDNWSGSMD